MPRAELGSRGRRFKSGQSDKVELHSAEAKEKALRTYDAGLNSLDGFGPRGEASCPGVCPFQHVWP
jgi:hypothetical protein